jgi:LysM repeat protein
MKKITENQLKDKVNSLREYLKVYENQQVDEWSMLSPSSWFNGRDYGDSTSRDDVRSQDAAKNSTAGGNMALVQNRESLAPGSVASEQGKDGVTYAVDAKGMRTHKIENNKWVAMNPPTPTEQPELMGAPDQGASVTPVDLDNMDIGFGPGKFAPDSTPALGAEAAKIAKFKALLAKAKEPSPYAIGTGATGGTGIKLKEASVDYFLNKLRLIESRQLNEVLTAAEQKELDDLAAELGNTEQPSPEVAELIKQYNASKAPAQAAAVTQTGPVTWKQIYDLNKDVIGANPNLIKPGQQLKMPDGSTYTVKAGDNLSKIAKNASGGQGASVAFQPKPPVAAPLTTAQQGFKDYGMAGQEMRSPAQIAASAGLADAPATPDAGLTPSDPRHSGHAAWKAQQDAAAATASQSAADAPGANARDDLLARRAKPVQSVAFQPTQKKYGGYGMAESVGYNELQRIVSLVNHR